MVQDNTCSSETLQKDTSAASDSANESEKLVVNAPAHEMQTASKAGATQKEQFSLVKSLQGFGGIFGQAAAEVVQGVTKTAVDTVQGATTATIDAAQATFEVVQGVTKTAADAVQGATTATVEAAQSTAEAISEATQGTAKAVTDAAGSAAKVAIQQNKNKLEAGQASKEASVAAHIKQVELSEIKKAVAALQAKYPSEKPAEITQRILTQQVPRASVIAGAIALIPGKVAEATGIDQATLILMQAETIYQIAAAYRFDVLEPERESEVFVIFDRALRASRMARMGLGFMQMIPFAGGVLNAGTDGYVLYLIGDTARNFFESKSKETVIGQALKSFVQETQKQYKRLW